MLTRGGSASDLPPQCGRMPEALMYVLYYESLISLFRGPAVGCRSPSSVALEGADLPHPRRRSEGAGPPRPLHESEGADPPLPWQEVLICRFHG